MLARHVHGDAQTRVAHTLLRATRRQPAPRCALANTHSRRRDMHAPTRIWALTHYFLSLSHSLYLSIFLSLSLFFLVYAMRCVAAGGRGPRRIRGEERREERSKGKGRNTDPLVLRSGPPPLAAKQTCNHVPTVVVLFRLLPPACLALGPITLFATLTCPSDTRDTHTHTHTHT